MGQLRTSVRLAIIDAVAKVPGAALDGNWPGVSGTLRDRIYAAVAERLLQRDRGTVATALTTALEDGSIARDEWKQILLGWAGERIQDSDKLSFLAKGLEDGKLTREEVIAAVTAWARTQVDDEAALALLGTLEDGRLEGGELKGALLAAAAELAGDSEVAQALRSGLADDSLSRGDVVAVVVVWGKRQIRDETLRSLFTALAGIAAGGTKEAAAQEVLARVLQGTGVDAEAVLAAVRDGRLNATQILLILATWSAAAGHLELADLARLLGEDGAGDPLAAAEALLQGGLPNGAQALFDKLLAGDWVGVLSVLLGTLELGLGGRLLRGLAGGRLREVALKKLTELLEKAGLQQAGAVAGAILDIVSGARTLFAEGEDADAGFRSPLELTIWREIRQVLYMAQLATFGGALVPSGAQDRPHIFQAAAIRFRTPLPQLVPADASEAQKQEYCNVVTAFLDEQLGDRMGKERFLAPPHPSLAITVTSLTPSPNAGTASSIFAEVRSRIVAALRASR